MYLRNRIIIIQSLFVIFVLTLFENEHVIFSASKVKYGVVTLTQLSSSTTKYNNIQQIVRPIYMYMKVKSYMYS